MRTLYIHAGGGKTGSSAIQNFLVNNKHALANCGYSYKTEKNNTNDYIITSGNGLILYNALKNGSDFINLIEKYFDNKSKAVCSTEFFSELSKKEWETFFSCCISLNIEVIVIFYIRNITEFLMSTYDQLVKRNNYSVPFKTYLEDNNGWFHTHFSTLKNLQENKHFCLYKILLYDITKHQLIESFLEAIDIQKEDMKYFTINRKIVNRSLTKKEREILLFINKNCNNKLISTEISNEFIYSNPEIETDKIDLNTELQEIIKRKYELPVNWVNETLFNQKTILSLFGDDAKFKKKVRNNSKGSIEPEFIALNYFVANYSLIKEQIEMSICSKFKKSIQNNTFEKKKLLPDDFDPTTYLLINKDVLNNGIDATEHYLKFGKKEGRKYQF